MNSQRGIITNHRVELHDILIPTVSFSLIIFFVVVVVHRDVAVDAVQRKGPVEEMEDIVYYNREEKRAQYLLS